MGLPEQYILYAGYNRPHKNLGRLIEAWARLQPQPLPLAIAGVLDPRFKMAERKAEILRLGDAIRFIGPVPESDLPALYCGAELFVFPSAYEGFGLPVLEAMACGTPVACSEAGSLPEIAGGAAVLFDPSDVDAMANAIEGTLANPDLRAALSRQSVTRAAQFSWETTGRLTLAAYRRFAM